jgi:hypothetical protein
MADIAAVDAIKETSGLLVTSYKLSLPAVDSAQIALALTPAKGTPVKIYEATLDPENTTVIAAHLIDDARIDRAEIKITGKTSSATIEVTSENADFRRRRVWRWTDADQRAKYPADTGLRFVSMASMQTVIFPSKEAQL